MPPPIITMPKSSAMNHAPSISCYQKRLNKENTMLPFR
jgi:hypothetical protein